MKSFLGLLGFALLFSVTHTVGVFATDWFNANSLLANPKQSAAVPTARHALPTGFDLNGPSSLGLVAWWPLEDDGYDRKGFYHAESRAAESDDWSITKGSGGFSRASLMATSACNNQIIFQAGSGGDFFDLICEPAEAKIEARVATPSCGVQAVTARGFIPSQSHRLALTFSIGGLLHLYVDGQEVGQPADLSGCTGEVRPAGGWIVGGGSKNVGLWNRALSAAEIQALTGTIAEPKAEVKEIPVEQIERARNFIQGLSEVVRRANLIP